MLIPKDKIVMIKHRRSKTSREFLVPMSGRTLQLISLFLKARQEGKFGFKDTITDDSYIITSEKFPYYRLAPTTLSKLFVQVSKKASIESHLPSDFRNSFISRMKAITYDSLVKTIVGHTLGLDKSYVIFDKETETNLDKGIINAYLEYKRCWKKLFDLDSTEEIEFKVREEFREENRKFEQQFLEMKMQLEELKEEREIADREQEEQIEIIAKQGTIEVADKLTKEEMLLLKKLIAKVSS